jgi:release factor glutamine methyltransferase
MSSSASHRSDVVAQLRAAGCVYAEDEAALLVAAAATPDELVVLVERRVGGEPLEYVLGWAEFCGLRLVVEPGVFVPRRRTEFLVQLAAARAPRSAVVVDLCCGSGAVGAALATLLDEIELHAVDVDPAAVRCARLNLAALGRVHQGDLYNPLPSELRGRVDVLVANAPYVPTGELRLMPPEARDHEARAALDGGADGLTVYRRVCAGAAHWLRPGGLLLVETSRAQAPAADAILSAVGLSARVERSDELEATVVVGVRT